MMIEDIDSPETIVQHRNVIQKKLFLRKVYLDFYRRIVRALPENAEQGKIVEIGSGGGFVKEILPKVITSDVVVAQGIDRVFQAENMPFADASIDAFVMLNCFHHFTDAEKSLGEINRCLKTGGKVVMVEPANTMLRRIIDKMFHSEPFDVKGGWLLHSQGRLSAANGALPWIVFSRDRKKFEQQFPSLIIERMTLHSPFKYLASGGLFYPAFLPGFMYPVVVAIEFLLQPLNYYLAYFQTIELKKI